MLEGCPIHPSIDYLFRCKRVTLSLTLKERVMHIWLLCCCSRFCYCRSRFRSINGSHCRSRLKNELCIFGFFVAAHAFAIVAHAFVPNGSHCRSHLKNELCRSHLKNELCIFGFFAAARSRFRSINGSYCRSCLKNELYIFAFFGVAQRFCYCRSSFRSKRVTSSLTLKERALSLTLKERVMHI